MRDGWAPGPVRITFIFLVAVALAAFSSGPVRAARFISLAEAWALAEANHPRMVEETRRLEGLRRDVVQREAAYDPTLSASVSGLRYRIAPDGTPDPGRVRPSLSASLKLPWGASVNASVSTSGGTASSGASENLRGSVGLNYPLFRSAELDADALALRQAAAALALGERELEQTADEVRADVLAALHADELAAMRLALAEEAYAEAEKAWEEARHKVDLGIASQMELLGAQIEWLRAEQEIVTARRSRQARRDQLLELLGLPEEEEEYVFESVFDWTGLPEAPPLEEAVAAAVARDTGLMQREEAAVVAELQLEEERRRPRFDSTLSASYDNTTEGNRDTGWTIGVSFTYPILDGGQRQRALASREEALERALEAVDDAEAAVRRQVEEAYVQLQDARRDEEIARLELTRAGLELELLRRQAELPVATAGDQAVRQGERALLRADLAWREAVQRYQSRWIALQLLLGPVEWDRLSGRGGEEDPGVGSRRGNRTSSAGRVEGST